MKKIICFTLSVLLISVASCQEIRTVTTTVTEENGEPIEGVSATVIYLGYNGETTQRVRGKTDTKGFFQAKGTPQLRMHVYLEKDGYYPTESGRLSRKQDHDVTFVLRKKKNPIPLYAKRSRLVSPVLGGNLGYDFEVRDWVKPHGKGVNTDLFFKVTYDKRSRQDFDYELQVTFPGEMDGIQEFRSTKFSDLRSPYEAPLNGYLSSWTQTHQRRPDIGRFGNRDDSRNYWIRVRSKVDEEGKLVSAHYIKMYGDFPDLHCYFNPTPNDRNLEFDRTQNLFRDLDTAERVRHP